MIRIEFWNGQLDKKGNLVKTKHNPYLWTNFDEINKPWRSSYKEALVVINKFHNKEFTDEEFLHHVRFVAYCLCKRNFDDKEVVWWGNMTELHKPKLIVENLDEKYTIHFYYENNQWNTQVEKGVIDFYWPL